MYVYDFNRINSTVVCSKIWNTSIIWQHWIQEIFFSRFPNRKFNSLLQANNKLIKYVYLIRGSIFRGIFPFSILILLYTIAGYIQYTIHILYFLLYLTTLFSLFRFFIYISQNFFMVFTRADFSLFFVMMGIKNVVAFFFWKIIGVFDKYVQMLCDGILRLYNKQIVYFPNIGIYAI